MRKKKMIASMFALVALTCLVGVTYGVTHSGATQIGGDPTTIDGALRMEITDATAGAGLLLSPAWFFGVADFDLINFGPGNDSILFQAGDATVLFSAGGSASGVADADHITYDDDIASVTNDELTIRGDSVELFSNNGRVRLKANTKSGGPKLILDANGNIIVEIRP